MSADLSGQRLGRYVLNRVLGRGGMGEVYEALDPETGRTVAIKVLPASLSAQPGYLDRFNQELKLAASLEHIHILPIYDHGHENGVTYIVMRYLTGSDLQKRLYKLGRPSVRDTRKLLWQIGDALDYAHSRGVVHRDLKPNNIMFDERGNAYLGDFGIAKVLGTSAGLTGTGQIIGTPDYMAPEQVTGHVVDTRADIYSLGIIAFQLLTGKLPFSAPTPYGMMYKHLNDPPPRPSNFRDNLDLYADEVIHRALAKDPNDRYQSTREMVEALDAALSDIPDSEQSTGFMTVQVETGATNQTYTPPATPKSRKRETRRRIPLVWIIGILGVFWAIVFAVIFLADDDETDPAPTETVEVVVQVTDTPTLSPTPPPPTETPTLSAISLEETAQSERDATVQKQTADFAAALTQTATLWTLTPTFDSTATINAQLTATRMREAELELTSTATLWTLTPTLDSTATINAQLTATRMREAELELTSTATLWTDTPTTTPSPTQSETPTATYTPSPNATETFAALSTEYAAGTATQSFIERFQEVISSNSEWETVVEEFDGIEMVLVPPGCFMMGSEEGDSDESPVHQICFEDPFWIDRYEVTQLDFARLGGTQAEPPQFSGGLRPVENITWLEARDFCELRGVRRPDQVEFRLPTQAEWEYVARGPDSLIFPWGNEFVIENVIFARTSNEQTSTVGSLPGGFSWVGAADMVGNVWEWTSSIYMDYPYNADDGRENNSDTTSTRVVQGGSWNNGANGVRASNRDGRGPDLRFIGVGFRCVRAF